MPYDFPASPSEGQEFHPPGGPTYVFSSPKWLIQGGTSGGGGGTGEASWDEITGKPATYPPTLPIAQSGVTNLPTDLAAKAPLASPGLTGTPTAPTAAPGTNTTQIASTAFVKGAVDANVEDWADITGKPATFPPALPIAQAGVTNLLTDLAAKAPINDPLLTGNARAPTAVTGDNTTQIATTAHVKANLVGFAPLASPSFTGDPKAPTPSLSDNDTSIATTQFVQGVVTTVLATKAPLDSPVFTGNPTAPTPNPGDNDTSIATTAYVRNEIAGNVEDWSTITGKPATFPPTVPIAQTDVTNLTTDLATKVAKTGDTMTGDLTIFKATPNLIINKAASGQNSMIVGQTNWNTRWAYVLGDVTAEGGSNSGSDFAIFRFSDAGGYLGAPLKINRATGLGTVEADPVVPLGIATKQYVDNKPGGGAATLIADVAPTVPAPVHGQLWWDSSTANLYIWYDDGTSAQWVQVNATGAA